MRSVYHWLLLSVLAWLVSLCEPERVSAQPATSSQVTCTMGAPVGARRYRPGAWSLVEFRAVNTTDEATDVQAVLRFVDEPTIQFSRRATVPAHSVLRSTCPVLVPASIPANKRAIDFLTERILPPKEIDPAKARTPQETMLRAQPMLLVNENPTVGMISELLHQRPQIHDYPYYTGSPQPWPEPDMPVYDMVLAAKRARRLSRRVSAFDPEDLPPVPACLDALDVLVLSSDRLASDPAGIATVRDWVLQGGRLWITLHDVQSETVSAVMGDAYTCTEVDRVELTSVTLRNAQLTEDDEPVDQLEFEEPVQFVRVFPEDVTTIYSVDGWPAAFWQPFGSGRVYFTTLGPAGWIRPTTGQDPGPISVEDQTNFFPRESLDELAAGLLAVRPTPELSTEAFKPFLAQQIGYQILDRVTVMCLLLAFCGLLAFAGWRLFRQGRSERILWIAPLTALAFGLVFLALGTFTKRSVPPTAATITRIVLERGVGVGHSSGLIALYNQDANSELLGARRGGIFFPDMTAMGGRNRRITWTDEGAWYWEDLELPAGVRTAPFEWSLVLDTAIDCRAHFGPEGLQGDIGPLPLSGLEDALIAIPFENVMAVSVTPGGAFRSGPKDVLARGEFLAESFLGDEQVRRKSIYEQLLGAKPQPGTLSRAMFYAWADPVDKGFVIPQPNRRDSTIFSIPLRLERTPAGTDVRIPAPFIPYRAVPNPDGKPPAAYANLVHEWVECTLTTTEWLRFQLPSTVLPLELHEISLAITVRAASRSLEILAPVDGKLVLIKQLSHPIGTFSCKIDDPELLQLDAEGGWRIAIRVSDDETVDAKDPMSKAAWKIEQLQVAATGTVTGS